MTECAPDRDRRSAPRKRRVAIVSLGCPKNQVDSELILGQLAESGAEIVGDPDAADTLVVNTCAFIDRARAESVEALLDAAAWKKARPGRRVVAAGCLVQRSGTELARAMPELDDLVGLDEISEAPRILAPRSARPLPQAGPARRLHSAEDPRRLLGPPHTAYVKIAEGCDQSCAFCAIPSFRGRQRSRPIEDIVREAAALAAAGTVEINLVAQDSTGYGRDRGERDGLAALLAALDRMPDGPRWVRVHYLYPGRITENLIETLATGRRIAEYVDLPLQHADPEILRRMRRPGDETSYLRLLDRLRDALPGAGFRSGFIVGFPGETDEQFERLCRFVEAARFDAVGVFAYSHEEGTPAAALEDDVPAEVKRERQEALEEIAAAVARDRNEERVGSVLELLVDGPAADHPGCASARWRGQAPEVDGRVLLEGAAGLPAGSIVRAVVTGADAAELTARPAERDAG